MAKRQPHQWAAYNLAIIGRNPAVFETKEEAIQYALENSKNQESPFIRVDEQDKMIDYQGKVYL